MARTLGMQPDEVQSAATAVDAHLGQLEQAASTVSLAKLMSASPSSYGLQPGDTVVAPWSLDEMVSAVTRVRAAGSLAALLAVWPVAGPASRQGRRSLAAQ
ncbi:hypothetical protein [Salinibacterium sp. ZJ454]|uniref:hypothetical protein n=1 Tax=Salinibacterium sp. ZJ454 TaxID=2708339 RepID=UPI001423265E|nr:hypothetical protein [Salinibacterium sp. ZJ454]